MREKILFFRTFMNKILIAFVVSMIFFSTLKVNQWVFICTIIILWAIIGINNKMSRNTKIYDSLVLISLGNLASIIVLQRFDKIEISYEGFMFLSAYGFTLLIISICSYFQNPKEKSCNSTEKLLRKRERDLERLLDYVDMFQIIALNGRWGTGKTFLVNELKKQPQIKKKYEIIEIDVLSSNLNELLLILVKEIENILYQNRIISRYSSKLKEFFGSNSWLNHFQSIILDNTKSYSELLKGLQDELSCLEKSVLIIYEDIDRINDVDIIKKLFSISEKLSNKKIKIIYQYHEENLKFMGFTNNYLEKYLPYKLNVTESDFFEIIRFILDKNNEKLLKISDFYFLRDSFQQYRYPILSNMLGLVIEINFNIQYIPYRKVETFYFELVKTLKNTEFIEHKETIIAFYVTKHFIPAIYEELNIDNGLLESINFEFNGEYYTMPELIALKSSGKLLTFQIEKMFHTKENRDKYSVQKLFNFQINNPEVEPQSRQKNSLDEPSQSLAQRISNEKKDRIIWNLLAAGKSEYTDYEFNGKDLINKVLKKPKKERNVAFINFRDDLYFLPENEFDNQTIDYIIGSPFFLELFKAFRILPNSDQYVKELVDLYFEIEEIELIDEKVIRTLNYALLPNIDVYVHIIKKFNQLEIRGNLNTHECFVTFINKFLCEALANLGFINTRRYFIFDSGTVSIVKKLFARDLNKIKVEMLSLQENLYGFVKSDLINDDITVIVGFIEKLIEIIEFPSEIQVSNKLINVEMKTERKYVNQNEFDKLNQMLVNEDDKAIEEIVNSFQSGKITPYEIDKLRIGNKLI